MLKRIIISLTLICILNIGAFADVAVKDLKNGEVEITFTYVENESPEMNVIGSFNDWTVPGYPMIKNTAGVWEYKLTAFADDELVYKFFYDGNYISDENAPDEKDDGFAGMNGLIIVADLLAEAAASTPLVAGETAPVIVSRKKVTFSTETYIESDTTFDKDLKAVDSTINAKSTFIFDGDLVKNMPGHIELTFFDGSSTIWKDGDDGVDLDDGFENLSSGFIFNPAYYLGGGSKPVLDKFKFGFDGKYLSYETGYGNTTLPEHKSVLWTTVQDDDDFSIKSEAGYSAFSTKLDLEGIGLKLNAAVVPNKSLDDFYGLYSYLNGSFGIINAEVQYDMKSGTTDNVEDMFKDIPRSDVIAGISVDLNPITLKAQFLNSNYISGGKVMALPAEDRIAAGLLASFIEEDKLGLTLEYKIRGYKADMLYVDSDDILGDVNTQKVDLETFYKMNQMITPKLDLNAVLLDEDAMSNNIVMSIKPGVALDFTESFGKSLTADIYSEISLNSKPGDDDETTIIVSATATIGDVIPELLNSLVINYGYDASDSAVTFNSLLLKGNLVNDFSAELGFGLRSGDDVDEAFGMSVGAAWTIPSAKAQKPKLYANVAYNLDPYETGSTTAELEDDRLENTSEGVTAIRFGIVWDY